MNIINAEKEFTYRIRRVPRTSEPQFVDPSEFGDPLTKIAIATPTTISIFKSTYCFIIPSQ